MKTKLTSIVVALLLISGTLAANNYTVSKDQSEVKWTGKKVTGEHHGTITFKTGAVQTNNKQITGGTFEIDMNTIVCLDLPAGEMNGKLVGHLKSDDFFSVASHPVSKLALTTVKKLKGNEYQFNGNLTIKGITHPVSFTATVDLAGESLKASGQLTVNRAKYDIRYGSGSFFSNLGDKMIYDDFTLDFNVVAYTKSGNPTAQN